ncbi:MAG: hypothetical protein V4529_16575 [Gemmatimonadota bacterium]
MSRLSAINDSNELAPREASPLPILDQYAELCRCIRADLAAGWEPRGCICAGLAVQPDASFEAYEATEPDAAAIAAIGAALALELASQRARIAFLNEQMVAGWVKRVSL